MSSSAMPKSFQGWPATKLIKDRASGRTGVEINADYLTPEGARGSFRLTMIAGLIFGGDLLLMMTSGPVRQDFFVMFVIVLIVFVLVTSRFVRWLYTKSLRVRVFHDRILVSGWRGDDEYSTKMDIQFGLQQHEKTLEEEASRKANPDASYYNNSADAVMIHAKQPVVLATIYPKKNAHKLIARVSGALEGLQMNIFETGAQK
ncbi:MAG: hypothetical protein JSS38_11200 [Nitrospira sp.]|nr:hypothetical protein [Nitrospira sp.]